MGCANLEHSVGALAALLLDDLEEDDVEQRARGQALQNSNQGILHGCLWLQRLGKRDADAGADRGDDGKSRYVDDGDVPPQTYNGRECLSPWFQSVAGKHSTIQSSEISLLTGIKRTTYRRVGR